MLGSGMPSSMVEGALKLLSLVGATSKPEVNAAAAGNSPDPGLASGKAGAKQFISLLNKVITAAGKSHAPASKGLAKAPGGSATGETGKDLTCPAELSLPPEIRELVGRLLVLAENGVLSPEEIRNLSEEDFRNLANWVMGGAGGLFPPLETPDILEKLKEWLSLFQAALTGGEVSPQAAPVESGSGEGAPQPPASEPAAGNYALPLAREVSELLQEILTASQTGDALTGNQDPAMAAAKPATATQLLLSAIAGLEELPATAKQALAEAFLREIARIASTGGTPAEAAGVAKTGAAPPAGIENYASETGGLSLPEVLRQMDPAVLKQALANAAREVGGPPLLLNQVEAGKLPPPVLQALAVEVIQVGQDADPDLLAELDLLARSNLLQRLANSPPATVPGNPGDAAAGSGKIIPGAETAISLETGDAPADTIPASALVLKTADGNDKARQGISNPPPGERAVGAATDNPEKILGSPGDEKKIATHPDGKSASEKQLVKPQFTPETKLAGNGANLSENPLPLENSIVTLYPGAEGAHVATPQPDPGGISQILSMPQNTTDAGAARYVDVERNLGQISQALRMSVRRGIQTATLRLSPPELGDLKLHVSVKQGVVSAKLMVDTVQARDLLHPGLAQLREHMEAAGIRTAELSVEYDADENNQAQRGGDFAQGFAQGHGSSRQAIEEELPEEREKPEIRGVFMEGGRVNTVA